MASAMQPSQGLLFTRLQVVELQAHLLSRVSSGPLLGMGVSYCGYLVWKSFLEMQKSKLRSFIHLPNKYFWGAFVEYWGYKVSAHDGARRWVYKWDTKRSRSPTKWQRHIVGVKFVQRGHSLSHKRWQGPFPGRADPELRLRGWVSS